MRRVTPPAASAIGTLWLFAVPAVAVAQSAHTVPVAVSVTHGTVRGVVRDEAGTGVAGAMVSALGPITAFAITGDGGQFELARLPPGPYLLRVHLPGYASPRGERVDVRAGARVASTIALHRIPVDDQSARPLDAALGSPAGEDDEVLDRLRASLQADAQTAGGAQEPQSQNTSDVEDEDDLAWHLRHLRRSILKDTVAVTVVAARSEDDGRSGAIGRAVSSPVRMAGDFLAVPFSGQVNLLTTSSFDDPAELFEGDSRARGITYVALGAPAGDHADWAVRGALTDGDLTAWIVAGTYRTRLDAPGRHRYDVRLSYSTERYDGGNPEALRAVADGSRNAGMVSWFDTYRVSRRIAVTYGGRYSHYDYLDNRTQISPEVHATFSPGDRTRLITRLASRGLAPGAEEFVPAADGSVWLPPQRTFSPAAPNGRLSAERTTHMDFGVERDLPGVTLTARAFRQHIDDQLVTLFDPDLPDRAAGSLGHYFVGGAGDADVSGWAAGARTAIAGRVTGAVEYSVSSARWTPGADVSYLLLLAPSVARPNGERVHDVSTRIETDMPETDTRVVVLYRLSDGFSPGDASDRPSLDSRFDVEVRQSLPFMDFSSARWEMLVGVRSFFRDPSAGQSIYDELLVVRPPKRLVGGLTVRF